MSAARPALPIRLTWPSRSDAGLIATAGAALLLCQYLAVRELSSTVFSTELVALLATLVTLVGPSLGYALVPRLGRRARYLLGAAALLVQLTLPFGPRLLCGTLASLLPTTGLALFALLAAAALLLPCALYAALLPERVPTAAALPGLYAAELAGSLLALACAGSLPSWHALLWVHYGLAGLALHLLLRRPRLTIGVGALATLLAAAYPTLDAMALRQFLRGVHGHAEPTVLATAYSPYQRIDVVSDGGRRMLYLDGVPFYRAGELAALPVFLARLPATLQLAAGRAPGPALVLGSGSFSSAAHLQRLGYDVTVVELDAQVAALGLTHLAAESGVRPESLHLVIDDGRRFLERTQNRYSLIVLDVPAPYHLHTSLLYTPDFYRQVRRSLAPGGVAAISLCDQVDGQVGAAIAASATAVFDDVLALHSAAMGMAVLYAASDKLPFDGAAAQTALVATEAPGGRVYLDREVRRLALDAAPLSEHDLSAVLALARLVTPTFGASH